MIPTNLENDIRWIGTYLDRYSFDFKCILPDERKLTDDVEFDNIFCRKEELENTLWIIDHEGGMYYSRGDLDNLLKKANLAVDLTLKMPEKLDKIRHMDNATISLLQKLSLRDHRFEIYLGYWKKFANSIDKIYQAKREQLNDANRALPKLEDFKVGDVVEFIKDYNAQHPIEYYAYVPPISKGARGIVEKITKSAVHVKVENIDNLVTLWDTPGTIQDKIDCLKIIK